MALFPLTEQLPPDTIDTINLARALSRLEARILTSDPHSRLRHSPYERTKTATNLEYARTILLRLEHSASGLKTQSRKRAAQETLLQQRNLIKKLNDRLYELGQQDDGALPSDSSEDDDILAALRDDSPAPETGDASCQPSASVPASPAAFAQPQARALETATAGQTGNGLTPTTTTSQSSAAPEPASTIRARRSAQPPSTSTTTTTAHSLLPSRSPAKPAGSSSPDLSTAHLLDSQSSAQADLTTSLLNLASQLKSSAQSFSEDLSLDTSTLSRTENSLGKNKDGIESASRRMGTLRKMSEGRWWWGRMVLYAAIAGLWIVAFFLVFVGPKLRF